MIKKKITKLYYFTNILNDKIKNNIQKFKKDLSIIYYPLVNNFDINSIISISKYCFKNNIPFLIPDNCRLAIKIKADGILISSLNKRNSHCNILNLRKFIILGAAHNQIDFSKKKNQFCDLIIFSPLFFNPKYSNNKILGPIKFNLITKDWKYKICALGGICSKNLNKLNLLRINSIGFSRFFGEFQIKKPTHLLK
jgi:thiamine monophosphate synthase